MKSAITISIDRSLLRSARTVACSNRRTLSAQIEQWMEDKLKSGPPPNETYEQQRNRLVREIKEREQQLDALDNS